MLPIDGLLALLGAMLALALVEWGVGRGLRVVERRSRLWTNLGLTAVTLALNLAGAGLLGLVAQALRARGVGLLHRVPGSALWLAILTVVVLDLSTYIGHRTMHRVSWLWWAHRVHHSDEHVDVTTSFRQHPIELALRFVAIALPAWALGLSPEALAAYRLLSAANALFEHVDLPVPRPLERLVSWLVVTPGMHKVHHSRERAEADSNYGNVLSVYDRLFGTWSAPRPTDAIVYGLGERTPPLPGAAAATLPPPTT